MKKLILIISVILSFGIIASPSYAKKASWGGGASVKPRYVYELVYSRYDWPYVSCTYAVYENNDKKNFVKYEKREIFQATYSGCHR